MDWTYLTLAGAVIWLGILLLPWRPWVNREILEGGDAHPAEDFSEITALIPARNEAKFLPFLLCGLRSQGKGLSAVLVNDQSTDGTAEKALVLGEEFVRVVEGRPLPSGWSGKPWALEQGYPHVHTRFTLLIDADRMERPEI
jgi:glycosyltransferase involved in cell wall biosynthesis